MKVVVTGGSGYIGARLSLYLAENGFETIPVCFSKIPVDENWKNKMAAVYQGDLRKEETIALISSLKADAIIHLVSLDHFKSESEPGLVNEVNVLPTWRLLDACCKEGLSKFIYFSTIHVYGKLQNITVNETQNIKPENAYGLTHQLSEDICNYYNRKTETAVLIARLSNSYGEPVFEDNNCWWLAINDLCNNAFLNKEIRLLSDGSPQRDFIHGNDVCKAVEKLLSQDSGKNENNIYHVSSGKTLTLLEIAFEIREIYQTRYGQILPVITPNGLITEMQNSAASERYCISNEKLKNTGVSLNYSLSNGINDFFNYLEKKHA